MDRLFYNIYRNLVCKKPWFYTFLAVLFTVLGFTASQIRFEEDITGLIPENEKTANVQKVLKATNFADKIIVDISVQPEGSTEDLTRYAAQFLDSVRQDSGKYIKHIQGSVADEDVLRTLDFLYRNLPLFLDREDYAVLKDRIHKDSIAAITRKNYRTLIAPTGIVAKKHILKDPLGLSFIALEKLRQLHAGDDFVIQDGFLFSRDKKHILLFISPAFETGETAKNEALIRNLHHIKDTLNRSFRNKVKSEYFGAPLVAVANAQQVKQDIRVTISVVTLVLLLILIGFYKKLITPVILFIPTIFGGLLALAFLYILRERISAISLGIGSVLLGITLDYSLHILTHLRNNNDVKTLYKETLRPILMSSLTTALAFLCLLLLHSQALQDLGIFVAISVMGASCFALLFIPGTYGKKVPAGHIRNSLLDRLAKYPLHKNKWAIGILGGVLLISLFTYREVRFDHDITKLNYEPASVKKTQQQLESFTDIASKSVYIIAYGKTGQEVLETNDRIYRKLKQLKAEKRVHSFSSAGIFLTSEKVQEQKIALWESFWDERTAEQTRNYLVESGNELGFKPDSFNAFFELLDKDFTRLQSEDYAELDFFPTEDFISGKNDLVTAATVVKAEKEEMREVFHTFRDYPGTMVIDRQQINETFLGNLKNDFNRLIGYSFLVILILIFLFFRNFSLTLVTCIPICLTWILTIGIMGMVHMEFNIFNIIISTFIFGLGIDYSIFMTNGLLLEYSTGEKTVVTYKTSVVLSVITTMLGIGALIFARHPALHSIALVSVIGILCAVFVTFTIQPLLFRIFIGTCNKRPVTLRLLLHSSLSFLYFGTGGILLSLLSSTLMKIIPVSKKTKMRWFHIGISRFMKSVLYTNPFVEKKVINQSGENFKKPALVIANHTSFLDILALGMLHPNMIFLVNDWVYRSPVFGKIAQLAGFYPVSGGIEKGIGHLQKKVEQGYFPIVFPEGTRSRTNKIRRFHKGAFYLSEKLGLDIIPVLIHGNSEVLPKGDHIIRDGSITIKILDRISPDDLYWGNNYTRRTKNISRYFRNEFQKLRDEIEHDTYFHPLVLENYKYKDRRIYKNVKAALKTNADQYTKILKSTGNRDTIIHLGKDCGQLDLLLVLDNAERKLTSHIENKKTRAILRNSYTANRSKMFFPDTAEEALAGNFHTLIICEDRIGEVNWETLVENGMNRLILQKRKERSKPDLPPRGFVLIFENDNLLICEKER